MLLAGHIKPWKDSTSSERLDLTNGLAACPSHDVAFEYFRGRFTVFLRAKSVLFGQHADQKRIQDMKGAYTTGSYVAIRISGSDGAAHAKAAARVVKR